MAYSCPQSFASYQYIEACPMDIEQWKERAAKKNCSRYPNCRRPLQYHCLLNAYKNRSIEVCAPKTRLIQDFCPAYSLGGQRITDQFNCSELFSDCPDQQYYSTDILNYKSCMRPLSQTSINDSTDSTSVRSTDLQNQSTISTMSFEENITFPTHIPATESYRYQYFAMLFIPVLIIFVTAIIFLQRRKKTKGRKKDDQRQNSGNIQETDTLINSEDVSLEEVKEDLEVNTQGEFPTEKLHPVIDEISGIAQVKQPISDRQDNLRATEMNQWEEINTRKMQKDAKSEFESCVKVEMNGKHSGIKNHDTIQPDNFEKNTGQIKKHEILKENTDIAVEENHDVALPEDTETSSDSNTSIKESILAEKKQSLIDKTSDVEDGEQRGMSEDIETSSDSNTSIKESNFADEKQSLIDRTSEVEDGEQRCFTPPGTPPSSTHHMVDDPYQMKYEDGDITSNDDLYHNQLNRERDFTGYTPRIGSYTSKGINPDTINVTPWPLLTFFSEGTTTMPESQQVIDNNLSAQPLSNNNTGINAVPLNNANNYRLTDGDVNSMGVNDFFQNFPGDIDIKKYEKNNLDIVQTNNPMMEVTTGRTEENGCKKLSEEANIGADKKDDGFTKIIRKLMADTLKEYFEPELKKGELSISEKKVRSSLTKQDKKISKLEKRLEEVEKKHQYIQILEERITALEKERKSYEDKLAHLQKKLVDLAEEKKQSEKAKDMFIQKVLQEKIKLREELDRKEKEICELREEVNDLKEELRDMLASKR